MKLYFHCIETLFSSVIFYLTKVLKAIRKQLYTYKSMFFPRILSDWYSDIVEGELITSIMVIYSFSTKSDVTIPYGYIKLGQDLNQGCGGWFLYIAYSKKL